MTYGAIALGSALSGRSYWSRRRDLMLMVLTHNIMILLPFELLQQIKLFYSRDGSLIPNLHAVSP